MNLICAVIGHEWHRAEKATSEAMARRACIRCGDKQQNVGTSVSPDAAIFFGSAWYTVGRFRRPLLDAEIQSWLRYEDLERGGGIVEQIRRME